MELMNVNKFLILLLIIPLFCFSQEGKNLYLDFNKNIDSIRIRTDTYNDTLTSKTFRFYKKIPKEDYRYHLKFHNGKISKFVETNLSHTKPGKLTLYYDSYKMKSYNCKEINIDKKNSITYKDFLETKFESFLQLLIDADKIFFILKKEKKIYGVKVFPY